MTELDNAKKEIDNFKKQLQETNDENEDLKTYADKLKNTVKDTVKKNEDLKKYADDLSDRNNNMLETNQKLDNEYRRMQHELDKRTQLKEQEMDKAYLDGQKTGKLELLEKWDGNRKSDIPLRKPDIFRHGGNFKRWLKNFQHFATASKIPENKRLDVLITYLDQTCQSKVDTLNFDRMQRLDFESCCEKLVRTIEGSNSKAEWRTKLFSAKQEPTESITDFVTRLNDMAERCYGTEKSTIKSQILYDCFINGLASEQICFEIIKNGTNDYATAYGQALDLEAIHALRSVKPKVEKKEVKFEDEETELFAIQNGQMPNFNRQNYQRPNFDRQYNQRSNFNRQQNQRQNFNNQWNDQAPNYDRRNDFQRNNQMRNSNRRNKFCNICQYNNHNTEECFFRQTPICMFCGRKGHKIEDCYTRLNQMARNSAKPSQSRGNYREIQKKFENNYNGNQSQEYRPRAVEQEYQQQHIDGKDRWRRFMELNNQELDKQEREEFMKKRSNLN